MNPQLIGSLIALLTPALVSVAAQYIPAISEFANSNAAWLVPAGTLIASIWNNLVTPVHKTPSSLVPPKK